MKTYTFRYKFKNVIDGAAAWLASSGCLFMVIAVLSGFPAWITHIVVCIHDKEWGFLIAGALFFPIAVIHGWGIWFGWWG
jgi:hypothetical protein